MLYVWCRNQHESKGFSISQRGPGDPVAIDNNLYYSVYEDEERDNLVDDCLPSENFREKYKGWVVVRGSCWEMNYDT